MGDTDPAELAAATTRALRWCAFMLAAMIAILLIDLQLKRAIGRQAVTAADKLAGITRMCDQILADLTRKGAPAGGRQDMAAASRRDHHPGLGGADGVDGTAPVPAGTDGAAGPVKAPRGRRQAGPRVGPPGDGPRADGHTGT
jgi:hypothetical protein